MSFEKIHPILHLQSWNDCVPALKELLEVYPNAETITFNFGNIALKPHTHKQLLEVLDGERIIAVQPLVLAYSPQEIKDLEISSFPVTKITKQVSSFKAQPLRDYLDKYTRELGQELSPNDLSVFFNQMGYSSLSFPLSAKTVSQILDVYDNKSRVWDSYVEHVSKDLEKYFSNPLIVFENLIHNQSTKKILLDANSLEPIFNGTSITVINFLNALAEYTTKTNPDWEISVLIPKESVDFFEIPSKNFQIIPSERDIDELFDLVVSITPLSSVSHCIKISNISPRWIVLHLDIISLRALALLSQNVGALSTVELYMRNADLIIFLTNAAKNDAYDYFGLYTSPAINSQIISLGGSQRRNKLLANNTKDTYVFVIGNDYPHKQVEIVVDALCEEGFKVISQTTSSTQHPFHTALKPGSLSEEELHLLMSESSALVFPSLYEGYGLPIADAAALGKPIVLWNTKTSKEVSRSIGSDQINFFCDSIPEVVAAVKEITSNSQEINIPVRTISDFSKELLTSMEKLLSEEVNTQKLRSRWKLFKQLEAMRNETQAETINKIAELHWRTRLKQIFLPKA